MTVLTPALCGQYAKICNNLCLYKRDLAIRPFMENFVIIARTWNNIYSGQELNPSEWSELRSAINNCKYIKQSDTESCIKFAKYIFEERFHERFASSDSIDLVLLFNNYTQFFYDAQQEYNRWKDNNSETTKLEMRKLWIGNVIKLQDQIQQSYMIALVN